jgi:hypothetical protein
MDLVGVVDSIVSVLRLITFQGQQRTTSEKRGARFSMFCFMGEHPSKRNF